MFRNLGTMIGLLLVITGYSVNDISTVNAKKKKVHKVKVVNQCNFDVKVKAVRSFTAVGNCDKKTIKAGRSGTLQCRSKKGIYIAKQGTAKKVKIPQKFRAMLKQRWSGTNNEIVLDSDLCTSWNPPKTFTHSVIVHNPCNHRIKIKAAKDRLIGQVRGIGNCDKATIPPKGSAKLSCTFKNNKGIRILPQGASLDVNNISSMPVFGQKVFEGTENTLKPNKIYCKSMK